MIVSEKLYKNLSDYIQYYLQKDLKLIKKEIISTEKMRNSDNYNNDYAHSVFRKNF